MKRPLMAVALLYGAGVVLGHFVEAPWLISFIVAFAFIVVALLIDPLRPLLVPAAVFLFGWLNMTVRTAIISPHDLRTIIQKPAELVVVRGRIASPPTERLFLRKGAEISHTIAELEIAWIQMQNGSWQRAAGRVMCRTAGTLSSQFVNGQGVEVVGIASVPPPPVARGVFDYARYLRSRAIHYEIRAGSRADWKVLGAETTQPLSERFRAWAQRTLARGLPERDESLRLQWAMLLGWQTALTAEVSEPFMRSGTMHIFAISGLHIALIAGIFLALLRAAMLPRFACGLIVIPILWFYTGVTGWQASAIRSTVMMTVIIAGWMLKRPTDLLNSLAAAACIILVWQPEQLFQASFQLSFFVVFSIALLSPPIDKLRTRIFSLDSMLPLELRPRWQRAAIKIASIAWTGFATSFTAFLGSMPLIAYYFHLFTPGSLLANLIVVPVSSLALMSGLGALVTGDLLPSLTECFNNAGWFFMRSMVWLSETVANLPAAWCFVRAPDVIAFVLYYGLLIAVCAGWLVNKLMRWIVLACALVMGIAELIRWQQGRSWHEVTVLPLSGGHAVYSQPARGAAEWLIDCGDRSAVDFTLKPFLQAHGISRLDHLVLSYGNARQMGGAARLNESFPVREVFVSPISFRSAVYRGTVSALEAHSRVRHCATNGLIVAPWKMLHPGNSERFTSAEDNAIVALGEFDEVRVLLTSDIARAGQNAIFTRHPDLRADIVISGLPEKGEPLASGWLEKLRPELIVVADSEFPAGDRASPALLKRLRRVGAMVVNTRESGAVTLRVRGASWRIETARPLSATAPERETDGPGVLDE